ncbi:MAG: alkaline phosphatase [Oscillospiraceae bacterium]|nr:alkaline phosphatase [Oscillospiraceae bacterium]
MNHKHWLVRWVALILAFSLLTLPGCKKSAPATEPTATTAATVAPTEESVAPTETESSDESAKPTEGADSTESTKPSATKKPAVTRPVATKKPAATATKKPAETKATAATKPAETKATSAPTNPAATEKPTTAAPKQGVKNVIFMIADGGGYDNFTLANKVKQTMQAQGINKLAGAKTQVTGNLLAGLGKSNVNGLYLNELLVGSANTLLTVNHGAENNPKSYITDSAAAGTALATGYKTQYTFLGLNEKKKPKASITELARMNGMATGLVTTKSYMDATPQAFFTSHSIYRYEYQDNSFQSLLSGIDVVIGEGTLYGDKYKEYPTSHPDLSASTVGYTIARNKTELLSKANSATTKKLWAAILGAGKTTENDRAADRITYDVDAAESAEQPSLLDMTKAALKVLGDNINDPDGFFLMIEGGALDNAAEGGCLRGAVGEYLAYDEAFGYCVNWAEKRGDTIVIAVPDHDSGGFSGIEACEKVLIESIITGKIGDTTITSETGFTAYKDLLTKAGADTSKMALQGEHTDMAVPISLYAPAEVRNDLLTAMGLPTAAGKIRTGSNEYYAKNESGDMTWYKSSALNNDYTIDNTKIAPALAKVLKLGSLDAATNSLFVAVGKYNNQTFSGNYGGELIFADTTHENYYAKYNCNTYKNGGLAISRNATTYTLNGVTKDIPKIGNAIPKALFVLDSSEQATKGTFYVPYSVLKDAGLK